MELNLLHFKKPVKVSEMSEQTVALKTAVKAKGKATPLEGLLKAGQIDVKDSKEFVKKLLEMTKKGEIELDKKGSVKLKNVEIKSEEIDQTTLLNIKNLLSQIKLNDKLAIEKSVKELRDSIPKSEDKKGAEAKNLKKLLELAKNGGVDVKSVSIEKLEEDKGTETKKSDKAQKNIEVGKSVDKKSVLEQKANGALEAGRVEKPIDKTAEKTEKTQEKPVEKSEKITDKVVSEIIQKQPEKLKSDTLQQEIKKESPSLASLLQEARPKEISKDIVNTVLVSEPRKEVKDDERHSKKDVKIAPETKKESSQKVSDTAMGVFKDAENADAKAKNEFFGLADLLAKKENQKDDSIAKKEHSLTPAFETQKQSASELKGKMAVAAEGLKNFSSDIKEMVENYKPPLMKVSMELNPQNLGSVDVTLITRGSNLVVNVTSTQDTMQMFMQNIQEFRQNLMAQGFVSLQMNFNFSEQNRDQNNRQWQKEAAKKYQINSDDMGKIESLDIVMPHPKYA